MVRTLPLIRSFFPQAAIFILIILGTACNDNDFPGRISQDHIARVLTDEIRSDSLERYTRWMQDMNTRYLFADNRREVAVDIREKFRSFGYHDACLDSFWLETTMDNINFKGWQYNVIATLEGSTFPDSVCILGAHYDDISNDGFAFTNAPGANDNASGVAASLETARVMKKNRYQPDVTVKFIAFAAEEAGLFGSLDYATKAAQSGEKIKLMLNNDMIAYETSTDPSEWIVNIIDYQTSFDLRIMAGKLCSKYTVLKHINDNTYSRYSDSYAFYVNSFRPLFFMSYDSDNRYHTVNDKTQYCNFDYCREVTALSCAILVFSSFRP